MKNRIIITALCAATLLGGCSKGVGEPDDGRGTVPIALRTGQLHTPSRAGILDGAAFLPEGESVGVFVADYAPDGAMSWTGASFVAQNAEGTLGTPSAGVQPITVGSAIFYKPERKHDIFAYFPYSASGISYEGTTGEPTLTAALTSTAQYDVITAVPVVGVTALSASTQTPNLSFFHRLSLMRFSMLKDAAITETLTLSKIEFTMDRSQTVAVNVATGTASSVSGGATGYEYSPSGGYALTTTAGQLCKFLFCPGTTITDIALTIDGEVYSTPAGWTGMAVPAAGSAVDVSVAIRPASITISLGEADWTDGGAISVTDHTLHSTILLGDAGWTDSGTSVTVGK